MTAPVEVGRETSYDATIADARATGRDADATPSAAPVRDALVLRRLGVQRLPGITHPFTLDALSPGVNVVHGPNGVGKSSTARAIETLLWPEDPADGVDAWAELACGGVTTRVEVVAGRRRAERDGAPCVPPAGRDADLRGRYRLALHELLAADRGGEEFAAAIRRQSQGGYDLDAAAAALGFAARTLPRTNATKAVDAAREARLAAQGRAEALQRRADELATLRGRRDEAQAAQTRGALLDAARRHAEARAALAEAAASLEAFPRALAAMTGDEAAVVSARRATLAVAHAEVAEAAAAAERADAEARAHFGGGPPPDVAALETLDGRIAQLAAAESTRAAAARAVRDAEVREQAARAALGADADEARLAAFDAGGAVSVAELTEHAAHADALRAERATLDARRRALDAERPASPVAPRPDAPHERTAPDVAVLRDAATLLARWLADGRPETSAPTVHAPGRAAVVALALVAAAAWVLLGWRWHPAAAAGGAVALALAWLALRTPGADRSAPPDPRAQRARDFAALGLTAFAPAAWTPDAVRAALDALHLAIVAHARAREAADAARVAADAWARRDRVWHDDAQAHAERRAAHDARRAALAARIGLAPDGTAAPDGRTLAALLDALGRWRDARTALAAARAAEDDARAAHADVAARVVAAFADGGAPDAGEVDRLDAVGARARLAALRADLTAHAAAVARADAARRAGAQAAARAAAIVDEIAGQFARAELASDAPDADAALAARCAQHAAWRAARDRHAAAERQHAATLVDACARPGCTDALLARDASDLAAEAADVAARGATLGDVSGELAVLEAAIAEAGRAHDVEAALDAEQRARDALRAQRDADAARAVGAALVAHVRQATQDAHRPLVFHTARTLFLDVTRGRWRLEFAEGEAAPFRAVDTTTGRGHALDELSGGTRVQLLLAVRLAFVETAEGDGARLPLLLDETLATSDDARAAAIVDAVVALAERGRQVFYFTAQHDEVRRWEAALAARGVAHAVHDLAAIRDARVGSLRPLPAAAPVIVVPAPHAGESHDAYGARLGHGPLDPRVETSGAVPLWYVVDDCAALHRWRCAGVATWGALRQLVVDGATPILVRGLDAAHARATACARALDAYLAAAAVGRGRPVDRATLLRDGELGEKWVDAMAPLLVACGGDARALIARLADGEVKGFGPTKCDQLRERLRLAGCLDERVPLGPDALRDAACLAVVDALADGLLHPDAIDALLRRVAAGPRPA